MDRPFIAAVSIVTLLALAGCGHNKSTTATQVVAKVNGREVTVSQLNQILASMNAPKSDPRVMQQATTRLITEELAVQAALKDKLDQDPDTQMRIEAAKRAILARAYGERMVFPKTPIPDAELRKFYDGNQAEFGSRRIYHFAGFETKVAVLPQGILAELDSAHTPEAVRSILERYKLEFQSGELTRGAENFPSELANRLAKSVVGDIVVTNGATGQSELLLLTKIESAPVSFDQAKAAISRHLIAQRNQTAMAAALKTLQAQAKIEYLDGRGSAK